MPAKISRSVFILSISATLLLSVVSCASVAPVKEEVRTVTVQPPDVDSSRSAGGVFLGKDDFKTRQESPDVIRFVVVPHGQLLGENSGRKKDVLPDRILKVLRLKLLSHIEKAGVTLVEAPADIRKDLPKSTRQVQDFLERNRIDALLTIEIQEPDRDRYVMESVLLDPYDRAVMGDLLIDLRGENLITSGNQVEFYLGRDSYYFLKGRVQPRFAFEGFNREVVDRFVNKSISARVNFVATDPEIRFTLVEKSGSRHKLGKTPVEKRLQEGLYTVIARRRGQKDQKRDFLVRAGREQVVLFAMEDRTQSTNLALYSAPANLRLSLDGVVRGRTPYFRTGMESGLYRGELARDKGNNKFIVEQEFFLDVARGKFNEILYMVDYSTEKGESFFSEGIWSTVSPGKLRVIQRENGYGLYTAGPNDQKPVGIVTKPLAPVSFDAEIELPAPAASYVLAGFVSAEDSILTEVSGNTMQPLYFKQGILQKPVQAYTPVEGANPPKRTISFRYNAESREMTVSFDGDRVMRKKLLGAKDLRLVIMTDRQSADGSIIFKNIRFVSGKNL